jgi:hypothetical protein
MTDSTNNVQNAGVIPYQGVVFPEVSSAPLKKAEQLRELLEFSPKMYSADTSTVYNSDLTVKTSLRITCKNGVIEGKYVDDLNNEVYLEVSEDGAGLLSVVNPTSLALGIE